MAVPAKTVLAKTRRTLVAAVLSLSVLIGSIVLAESGLASSATLHGPRSLLAAPSARHWRTGGVECRVTPRGSTSGRPRPLLVALGASFTAGVGAGRPSQSWAIRLAELIQWRAVTIGVPGAGYVAAGPGRIGPVSREVIRAQLGALHPGLIIVQAGHDDLRIPPGEVAARVASLVRGLRAAAPDAGLAFLTVFSAPDAAGRLLARELSIDSAIAAAIRRADAGAVIIDPLRGHWRFPRADGGAGLHPSSGGHLVIAERVARALARAGVVPAAASRPQPATVTCTRLAAASTGTR
jgi:lysophospholipase L1-like esterase